MSFLHILTLVPATLLAYVAAAFLFMHVSSPAAAADWRDLSREPVGLAPDPAATPEPVVQVYAARARLMDAGSAIHRNCSRTSAVQRWRH